MNCFKALLFDLNGTLINIWTDENREEVYRTTANLLCDYGVPLSPDKFKTLFYELMKQQRKEKNTEHPEFDVIGLFRTVLAEKGTTYTRSLPKTMRTLLPEFLARVFRASSMLRLEVYPGVHKVLDELRGKYILAAVSDAQSVWAESELRRLDLAKYFPVRVISGDFGFRKPSPELFQTVLDRLALTPQEVIYVGNDMHRDVYGSKRMGMKSVFFRSNQGDQRPHGYEPDYIIYSFEQLPEAIRFLEGNIKTFDKKP